MVFSVIASIITLLIVGSASLYLVVNRVKINKITSDLSDHEILNQNRRTEHIQLLNDFTDQVNNANKTIHSNVSDINSLLNATIAGNNIEFSNVNTNHYNLVLNTQKQFREIDSNIKYNRHINESQDILIRNNFSNLSNRDTQLSDRIQTTNNRISSNIDSMAIINSRLSIHRSDISHIQSLVATNISTIFSNASVDSNMGAVLQNDLHYLTSTVSNDVARQIDKINNFFSHKYSDSIIADTPNFSDINNTNNMDFQTYMTNIYIKPYYDKNNDSNTTFVDFLEKSAAVRSDFYSLSNWKNTHSDNISSISTMQSTINRHSNSISSNLDVLTNHHRRLLTVETQMSTSIDNINSNLENVLQNSNIIDGISTSLANLKNNNVSKSEFKRVTDNLSDLNSDYIGTSNRVNELEIWRNASARNFAFLSNMDGDAAEELVFQNTLFSVPSKIDDGVEIPRKTINIDNIIKSKDYTDFIGNIHSNFFTVTDKSDGTNRIGIFDSYLDVEGGIDEGVGSGTMYIEKKTVFPNEANFDNFTHFNSNVSFNADVTVDSDITLKKNLIADEARIQTQQLVLQGVDNIKFSGLEYSDLSDYLNAKYASKVARDKDGLETGTWVDTSMLTDTLNDYYTQSEVDNEITTKIGTASSDYLKSNDPLLSPLKNNMVYTNLGESRYDFYDHPIKFHNNLEVTTFENIKATHIESGGITGRQSLDLYITNKIQTDAVLKSEVEDDKQYIRDLAYTNNTNELTITKNYPLDKNKITYDTAVTLNLSNLAVVRKADMLERNFINTSNVIDDLIDTKFMDEYNTTNTKIPLVDNEYGENKIIIEPGNGVDRPTKSIKFGTELVDVDGGGRTAIPKVQICLGENCYYLWNSGNAKSTDTGQLTPVTT